MPRDVETITADLREVVSILALKTVTGDDRARFVEMFHSLHREKMLARRAEAVWRVYFMHAPVVRLVKIGATSSLNSRLLALQNGSPVPLTLLGCLDGGKEVEKSLHTQWAILRSHGEWFHETDDLMAFIRKAVCA